MSRPGRGESTRATIVSAAEELVRERGYDRTTMREVPSAYFASKERLVHGFYARLQRNHALAAGAARRGTAATDPVPG